MLMSEERDKGGTFVKVTVGLPSALVEEIDALAREQYQRRSEVVRMLLGRAVRKEKGHASAD